MFTKGEYSDSNNTFGVIVNHDKKETEIILIKQGKVYSAYKNDKLNEYSYINNKAIEVYNIISNGLKSCKAKNGSAIPFKLGTSIIHEFQKQKAEYNIELFNSLMVGAEISSDSYKIRLEYLEKNLIPQGIPYIKLTQSKANIECDDDNEVRIRSVDEIALGKEDVSWLKNKKYYIVNDDATAEKLFKYLDNYSGAIAYDTETTGLKINCFGKINSKYKKSLYKYNMLHQDDTIRADSLVGIIFCVEKDVSYYFPCGNRKFKNLFVSGDIRNSICKNIKSRYMIGDKRDVVSEMADYIRNTPIEEFTSDVILMERCRDILEKKHIVAHNGAFEWKVGWQYEIDTNLTDDTMIMHQIMYKFRSTTSNRGEPSNLKYLARVELGIEQWELGDFFPDFKEEKSGTVRAKADKKGRIRKTSIIDFSFMDYDGTRIYAPTDGDVTYQLFVKYKSDLMQNHKEQEYIYNVEIIVARAVAYMEFYGLKIDETKVENTRDQYIAEKAIYESEIRQSIQFSSNDELLSYNRLNGLLGVKNRTYDQWEELRKLSKELDNIMANDVDHQLNLSSPKQMCELFYDKLKIPIQGEKPSVDKKTRKALLKAKNDDGSFKYPIVNKYSEYVNTNTLLTKFFDNLPYFTYPGGYMFAHFGQIATATGRMSCNKPNLQQMPKSIAKIIIPREGFVMMDADYSQIEYRVLVALSGEEHLAKLFEDPDNDYHTLMASLMYGVPYASVTPKMRGDAKSFNFGIPYGMGFGSLSILLNGSNTPAGREEAKKKYELYFKDQPKTRIFFDQVKEMAQVNKYTKTFWSRYRYYSFEDKDGNVNNARKAASLRQAGNAIIQGSAADLFKISVARNFNYIRQNGLIGKVLISNMIHDEQLLEVDVQSLNMGRVVADIGNNMQFKIDGFPPLYIGAGIGPAWGEAKGKMTEIHPHLLDEFMEEGKSIPLWRDKSEKQYVDPSEVLKYFNKRVMDFRIKKVRDYLLNTENHNKEIHPAIGNLLNLQFNYGHDKEKENLTDEELTSLCLEGFISEYLSDSGLSSVTFNISDMQQEKDVDEDYEDDEDEEIDEFGDVTYAETDFALLDESKVQYGSSVQDIIKTFTFLVAPHLKVCGIDMNILSESQKDNIINFLCEHICEPDEIGAMEIVYLNSNNILVNKGIYVKDINGSDIETRIKTSSLSKRVSA